MSQINSIKEKYAMGKKVSEIARELQLDVKTVKKYLTQKDFSPRMPKKEKRGSKLDPYKEQIEQWLQNDEEAWYKQRHTAQRIYDRLKEQEADFSASYPTVQRYVKEWKQVRQKNKVYQELVWHPAEAQVDFGEADFIEQTQRIRKKYLTVSFPYSNDSFSQVFGGETSECVCQGLKDIFEYIGGVPRVLVFDNATGIGQRVGRQVREAQLFQQMRAHYGFLAKFCNPYSGHEKGHVENKVGYTRKNMFVPIPHYSDIEEYNRGLLQAHGKKAEEDHYKKGKKISELFLEDQKALRPLPDHPFSVCRYVYKPADSYGKVRIDDRHYYSTCPEFGGAEVLVGIRAHFIDIYTEQNTLLVTHLRTYGEQRSDTLDYRTTLATLTKTIGAWTNSGVRETIPISLREQMDQMAQEELRQTIRTLSKLTKEYSFETAIDAVQEGLRFHRTQFSDAAVFAARLQNYGLDTPPEKGPDLRAYDQLLKEEVTYAHS